MTKLTGVKLSGVKLKHEFTFLSIPGLKFLFDPSKGITTYPGGNVKVLRDTNGLRLSNSSGAINSPTVVDGLGGFRALRFSGNQRLASIDTRTTFNWLHEGHKIAVFTVIQPLATANNLQNVILGSTTNSGPSIGFHITLDDRDSLSRDNVIISGIMKGSGVALGSGSVNPAPNSLTDIRLVQTCFRGARTGGDFEIYINKVLEVGNELTNPAASGNASFVFGLGHPQSGQPSNHDNYLSIGFDWDDATDSEYETRRLLVEGLIYQKFNASSTILPE